MIKKIIAWLVSFMNLEEDAAFHILLVTVSAGGFMAALVIQLLSIIFKSTILGMISMVMYVLFVSNTTCVINYAVAVVSDGGCELNDEILISNIKKDE